MNKKIYTYDEVKEEVKRGLNAIANPIRQTLSPKGGDVLIETDHGDTYHTNDGVTIAKSIQLYEPIGSVVADIVKSASLRTNSEAGDGTSTTALLSQVLTLEGLKMKDEGYSRLEIRDKFLKMAEVLKAKIKKNAKKIKTDDDLFNIARISANNDEHIAKDVVDVVKTAGEDGMVFLESNNSIETEIDKDLGFMIKGGIMYQELLIDKGKPVVDFKDVPVFITDKNIYHEEEAETILRTAIKSGYDKVVVVAQNFSGNAVSTFIKNHQDGNIRVALVKDPKATKDDNLSLDDLAQYLGGKLYSDRGGSLVNKLKPEDFVLADVLTDPQKTLITPKKTDSKSLKERVKYIREELKKDKNNDKLKERLASLTTGVVTVRVGGHTNAEMRERIYRYEDAVNATRSSMKEGYVVGGGMSLLKSYDPKDYGGIMQSVAKRYCEAVIRQIAENCGKHANTIIENVNSKSFSYGYNALTDTYEDLFKAGVVDPVMVLQLSIDNSVSIANIITGINSYIINDREHDEEKSKGE